MGEGRSIHLFEYYIVDLFKFQKKAESSPMLITMLTTSYSIISNMAGGFRFSTYALELECADTTLSVSVRHDCVRYCSEGG